MRTCAADVSLDDTFAGVIAKHGLARAKADPNALTKHERGMVMAAAADWTAVATWSRSRHPGRHPCYAVTEMAATLRRTLAHRPRYVPRFHEYKREADALRTEWQAAGRPGLAPARQIIREYVTSLALPVAP